MKRAWATLMIKRSRLFWNVLLLYIAKHQECIYYWIILLFIWIHKTTKKVHLKKKSKQKCQLLVDAKVFSSSQTFPESYCAKTQNGLFLNITQDIFYMVQPESQCDSFNPVYIFKWIYKNSHCKAFPLPGPLSSHGSPHFPLPISLQTRITFSLF